MAEELLGTARSSYDETIERIDVECADLRARLADAKEQLGQRDREVCLMLDAIGLRAQRTPHPPVIRRCATPSFFLHQVHQLQKDLEQSREALHRATVLADAAYDDAEAAAAAQARSSSPPSTPLAEGTMYTHVPAGRASKPTQTLKSAIFTFLHSSLTTPSSPIPSHRIAAEDQMAGGGL